MFSEKITLEQAKYICKKLNLGDFVRFSPYSITVKNTLNTSELCILNDDEENIEITVEVEYFIFDEEILCSDSPMSYKDVIKYRKILYQFFGIQYLEYLVFKKILTWEK